MKHLLRKGVQFFIAKPIAKLLIGMDVIGKTKLPEKGPAIIAANHNSYIDTLIMLCLFSTRVLPRVKPVGAADHFMKTPLMRWLSIYVVGMIPIERKLGGEGKDLLADCRAALDEDYILIIFPEGTRGEAEEIAHFKTGIARLAKSFPKVPVFPVYIQGAGRVWPRGSNMFVPFNCTAVVGDCLTWEKDSGDDRHRFMDALKLTIQELRKDAVPLRWD